MENTYTGGFYGNSLEINIDGNKTKLSNPNTEEGLNVFMFVSITTPFKNTVHPDILNNFTHFGLWHI